MAGSWKWDVVEGWGDGEGEEDVNGSEGGAREEELGLGISFPGIASNLVF